MSDDSDFIRMILHFQNFDLQGEAAIKTHNASDGPAWSRRSTIIGIIAAYPYSLSVSVTQTTNTKEKFHPSNLGRDDPNDRSGATV